jgi:hypothetical protein
MLNRELAGYPIDHDVLTTLQRTVVPDPRPPGSKRLFPFEVARYEENGYGRWHYGAGVECERRLDLLSPRPRDKSVTKAV